MSDTRFAIEVFIFGAKGFGGSLMFATPQVTIGRDPRSQVHLEDPSVSLRHAVLDVVGDSVRVRDLGSRTGTVINGRPIAQQVTLQPTDELLVGTYRLRLTIHRPEAASTPPGPNPRAGAMSVPTPIDGVPVPVPVDRGLLRPATQRIEPQRIEPQRIEPQRAEPQRLEPPVRPSLPSDDEVTATGVLPKPAPPPRPPDEKSIGLGALYADAEATVTRPSPAAPKERVYTPVPPSLTQAPVPPPPPAMGGPTVPLTFRPAMLASAKPEPPPSSRAGTKEPTARRAAAPVSTRPPPVLAFAGRIADGDSDEDEDEDEDEDADFVPPFDLLQTLTRVGTHADAAARPVAVEAIHFRGDRVLAIYHVPAGQKLRVAGLELGSRDRSGVFVLDPKACGTATVRQDGRRVPAEAIEARLAGGLTLASGMQVVIQLPQDDAVLVQIVPRAKALAPVERSLRPLLERLKPGAASVGVHLLLLVIFGITMLRGKNAIADDVNEGRFATIALQPVEIEPPPPPELPPSVDKTLSTIPSRVPRHEPAAAKSNAKVSDRPTEKDSKPADDTSASAQNILKALGGSAPATPDISALNMDAMPRGRSGFRVSDAVGKGPGDSLRVGVGDADGAVNTKSASELGNVGKLEVKPGTGAVRARVSAVPAGVSGEGHLDRGAIQKVVNAHLYQVQGCYERQLAANPSLAGKATFQWVINPSGGVAGVRIAQSSIGSVEVMSCIQGAISRWSFPKPEGGSVTVTYPFAFTTFGN
jgi:pSer/pThr/pTyr-binding forkhead associated (FHA) protein